jgi:UDP-N-acetylmuramate-alanine ligase
MFFMMYKRNGNQDLHFGLPGRHNLMNALMAIAMAKLFGTNIHAAKPLHH